MQLNRFLAALVLAGALIPAAAGAVTTTTVVATDGQQAVPRSSVQLFDTATGAEVKQEDEDDDGAAVFLLPQGSYRVVINGTPIEEFTVTGEGTRTVAVSVGGAAGLAGAGGHDGPEFYVGVEGAWLWHAGDDFVGGPGGDADLFGAPDSGIGGRIFASAEFNEMYLARGTFNGARLRGENRESLISDTVQLEGDLDMIWATAEFFRLWSSPSWFFGLGGGVEYADISRSFEETIRNSSGVKVFGFTQESGFWGVGPRVTGFVESDLFAGGVRGFAEGGVAYLFGGRETSIHVDSGGSEFGERESEGDQILHYGARVGLKREFQGDGASFILYGGYQFDLFQDSSNTEFFPNQAFGDDAAHGPFIGIGVRWGAPPPP
jgi:hypothetical protein